MKITKILTASILCLSLILSITACTDGKGSSSTISLTSEQQGVISNAASLLPEDELENKVVKQYGFYDINGAADIVPAINLFEQKYGGKIEYVQVDWDQRFTALANLIMSGNRLTSSQERKMYGLTELAIINMRHWMNISILNRHYGAVQRQLPTNIYGRANTIMYRG